MFSANDAGRLADTLLDRSVLGGYPRWGLALRRRLPGWPGDPAPDALRGLSAAVTGANSGLGKATAAGLARLGATVHLVVRDPAKGEKAREELALPDARVWRCDVGDLDDVRRFAEEFSAAVPTLDVLVHNAGVLPPERQTSSGHEQTLATHVLGPLRMTELLRPTLRGGRVIIVSSGGMYTQKLPVDDLEYREGTYRGVTAYARTKRVQVTLLPILAERWAADGILVYGTHPGWAGTPGITGALPGFHRLAAATPPPRTGLFWHDRKSRPESLLPWTHADDVQRRQVWDYCAHAAGIAEFVP